MKARSFKDLIVWQKAHQMVKDVYLITELFPKEEKYSLISQLRRAALSVPANISEGFGRYHLKEKIQFYMISKGSLNETENYLKLAEDLGYCDTSSLQYSCTEIRKILNAYISSIKRSPDY
jgi:four helix bundle protein